MTEPAKLCEICKTNETEFGRVCDECKKMPKDPDDGSLRQWLDEVDEIKVFTCEIHGVHQGVKIGRNWSSHCPHCIQEKRTAGVRRTQGQQRHPRQTPPVDEDKSSTKAPDDPWVLIDFSDCRWVIGLIKKETCLPLSVHIKRKIIHDLLDRLSDAELKLIIMSGLV